MLLIILKMPKVLIPVLAPARPVSQAPVEWLMPPLIQEMIVALLAVELATAKAAQLSVIGVPVEMATVCPVKPV